MENVVKTLNLVVIEPRFPSAGTHLLRSTLKAEMLIFVTESDSVIYGDDFIGGWAKAQSK